MALDLSSVDQWIRTGCWAKAHEALKDKTAADFPGDELAPAAQLCWRAGLPEVGLKLLRRRVRPSSRHAFADATSEEKAEYAACLIRLNALDEASELLKSLRAATTPRVWLYRAFLHMSRWEYREAIPFLKAFLKAKGVPAYPKLVAQVNLASALIYERKHLEATYLLRQVTHQTSLQGLNLLLGNSLELSAANFIYLGKLKQAETFLDRAEKLFREQRSLDAFFARKWRGMIHFLRSGDRRALERIRKEALTGGYWESLRDCDRFEAQRLRDTTLLWKVYFGTPYPSYRARLLREFKGASKAPPSFELELGANPKKTLDLFQDGSLKPGSLPYRLIYSLVSDFYRPCTPSLLFAKIFPGERFSVASLHRVHQSVFRLREWLEEKKLPLQISEARGCYRLTSRVPCRLFLPSFANAGETWRGSFYQLEKEFGKVAFSVGEARRKLGVSGSSVLRILKQGQAKGLVQRTGRGKAVRYRLTA